ncbi:MAG: zf-HC2 domain-containing protein [Vicinamibacterales bacterium]
MKVLICEEVRPQLEEYHDDELPVSDQIAVRAHLEWCDECSALFTDLRLMRGFIRAGAPGQLLDHDERSAFEAAVIGRARAEQDQSWSAQVRETLDDRHVAYACLGAVAATVFCVLVLANMLRLTNQAAPGSLAEVFRALATPKVVLPDVNAPGTDGNPVVVDAQMHMPRALDQIFVSPEPTSGEAVFTLSAVVTREGRLKNLEWHSPSGRTPKAGSREAEAVDTLLSAASVARFEPARVQGGSPIAVNMIWLVANTTVRGSKPAFDAPPAELPPTGPPAPRKRRVDVVIGSHPHGARTA